jgi:hypothetical protein
VKCGRDDKGKRVVMDSVIFEATMKNENTLNKIIKSLPQYELINSKERLYGFDLLEAPENEFKNIYIQVKSQEKDRDIKKIRNSDYDASIGIDDLLIGFKSG